MNDLGPWEKLALWIVAVMLVGGLAATYSSRRAGRRDR